nr:MAG TPA: portal protein [Bacteriophage sp.]
MKDTTAKNKIYNNPDKALPSSGSYLVARVPYSNLVSKPISRGTEITTEDLIQSNSTQDFNSDVLSIYAEAEMILDQLDQDILTVGRLTTSQKKSLFYYLSIFSPLVSRIIDLHTKLPLSTFRIQKPKHDIDIVQDYVYDYFDRLVNTAKFKEELKNIIKERCIFGSGIARVEDDYAFTKDTLINPDLSNLTLPQLNQEDIDKINEINNQYNSDPESVSWQDKKFVLEQYLLKINKDYKGIKNFKSVSLLEVKEISINKDIDYLIYTLPASPNIKQALSNVTLGYGEDDKDYKEAVETLKSLGYSEAIIKLNLNSEQTDSIQVDTDAFNDDGAYMVVLCSGSNPESLEDSILNRILEPAVRNMNAIRTANKLVKLSTKIDRLVSAPKASLAQLNQLQNDLVQMAESPEGSLIAVNFEVNVDELKLDIKDDLNLDDTIERTSKEITSALGIPDSIISGEGTYGDSFIKVELLSTEYVEFRNQIKSFIEDEIFKPIAIKKGFITLDQWGEPTPIIPSVRFDKFSIARGSEDMQMLRDLVSSNILPKRVILEHLGMNVEDVEQGLQREQLTYLNEKVQDSMNENINEILTTYLKDNPDLIKTALEALGFNAEEALKQHQDQNSNKEGY